MSYVEIIIRMLRKNSEKQKQKRKVNRRRMPIKVNIVGSSGALRLVVNEDDVVSDVIHAALKSYARLGRLPLLGSDANHFLLYSSSVTFDVWSPTETIGSCGFRDFVLRKKAVKETRGFQIKDETNNKQNRGWNSKKWNSCFTTKANPDIDLCVLVQYIGKLIGSTLYNLWDYNGDPVENIKCLNFMI
ncbi:uncharacterized protein LOC114727347 [Neltuma alba]|uniref:uncharacterized protein LOC114727347 n=1 Tax=Neltuma alba TaxID=207710 RepID=UPI0010A2C24A|nr:uncharacterized protein LOC114727347 [Prosopis alba]